VDLSPATFCFDALAATVDRGPFQTRADLNTVAEDPLLCHGSRRLGTGQEVVRLRFRELADLQPITLRFTVGGGKDPPPP
jgi:hypothetical protein